MTGRIATYCIRGHRLEGDNLYIVPRIGRRVCKTCQFIRTQKWYERHPDRHAQDILKNNEFSSLRYFGGLRETAIQRDGEKCIKCGMTRAEHRRKYGRDITVDHKDGRGCNTPIEKRNNTLSNLQTLCLSCHGVKDKIIAIVERKTY
jgi:hypothetical protein